MENLIIMAHRGMPGDPPIINMPHGPIVFERGPNNDSIWIGYCTPEQVEDLKPYDFFFPFTQEIPAPKIEKDKVPDETWNRAGIAEWAEEELGVTISMKLKKADMLAELKVAIAARAEEALQPAPEDAPAPPKEAEAPKQEEPAPESAAPEAPAPSEIPLVIS